MRRGRTLLARCAVLAVLAPACTTGGGRPSAAAPSTSAAAGPTTSAGPLVEASATGMCRSELARAVATGAANPEWIDLGIELTQAGEVDGPVIEANDVTDLGPDTPPPKEGPHELGRRVRFDGVTLLRGPAPSDLPMVISKYDLADAKAEREGGGRILARIDSRDHDGRLLVGPMVSTRPDGTAAILGDCHPRWGAAFATYSARVGARPADLVRSVLLEPRGPAATAFVSSPEARTSAGP